MEFNGNIMHPLAVGTMDRIGDELQVQNDGGKSDYNISGDELENYTKRFV